MENKGCEAHVDRNLFSCFCWKGVFKFNHTYSFQNCIVEGYKIGIKKGNKALKHLIWYFYFKITK